MGDRIYGYVDGESHYIRSRDHLKAVHSQDAELADYSSGSSGSYLYVHAKGHFVWEYDEWQQRQYTRIVYFTSLAGTDQEVFELETLVRKADLEPHVVHEPSTLAKQRENQREKQGYIYKPKGVDIALATRMLEDAYLDNYDKAVLFTSDIEFLPVIKAVRRMGKVVDVVGHSSGIGEHSPFRTVPDQFQDLCCRAHRFRKTPPPTA